MIVCKDITAYEKKQQTLSFYMFCYFMLTAEREARQLIVLHGDSMYVCV